MAFKGKDAEHQLAMRRMNDIGAGIRAHREIMGGAEASSEGE